MTSAAAPTSSPLGRYIRAARESAGLSQDELAARIQHSQPAVSGWEAGKKVPSAKAIGALDRELPAADATEMLSLLTDEPVAS